MKRAKNIHAMLFIGCIVALCGCQSDGESPTSQHLEKADSLQGPLIVAAGSPILTELTNVNAPQVISLAQKPAPISTQADFYIDMHNFNTEDGLAMSTILCGLKDSSGTLWFGTSGNGVSMYTGKKFTNYNSAHGLIHNLINTIIEDKNGALWFGTYGGISIYDGYTFENFTTEEGLLDNDVLAIAEGRHGAMWIGSDKGLSLINRKGKKIEISTFEENSKVPKMLVNAILQDGLDNLWVAGTKGLWKKENNSSHSSDISFTDYSEAIGLPESSIIMSLLEDRNGILWIGTTHGLFRINTQVEKEQTTKFPVLTTADGLGDNTIYAITEDADGAMWLGTAAGVSKYIPNKDYFLNFSTEQGLAFNRVNSITTDGSGNLWFGTHGGGLDRYMGDAVLEYTGKQGFPGNAVYATAQDAEGTMWFAPANGGIVAFNQGSPPGYDGTFLNYTTVHGLLNDTHFCAVADAEGAIYFGGSQGITKFTGSQLVNYTAEQGLPSSEVTVLYIDSTGKLYIGTYEHGISVFDGSTFRNFDKSKGLVHNTIWGFWEDTSGALWVATRGGLSRFDGTNFMNFTTDQGLPDDKLSSVIQDKNGNIIIGSWGGGISVIKSARLEEILETPQTISEPIFENFSTTHGLANDVVYQIIEDESGDIIIGTNVGFTVFKGGIASEKGKIAQLGHLNYNEKTNYPIKDISNNASMHREMGGIIWAGTGDKLVRFNLNAIKENSDPPTVFLQNIRINNESISWHSLARSKKSRQNETTTGPKVSTHTTDELLTFDRKLAPSERDTMARKFRNVTFDSIQPFYALPAGLELPYTKNNVSFEFTGIETFRPNLIRYQYMLEGYDEEWNPITENTTASFGNIPEGDFTFLVKAKSPDGIWSEPLAYQFTVKPPWYRSLFAYIFYIILFMVGVYLVDRFQRQRLVAREKRKILTRELEHAREIEKAYAELKATQAQLIHSEKMASLGKLTAGVAHEIQNPLNFVNNFSELSYELIGEMNAEIEKGDLKEARVIARDIQHNLQKISVHGKRADAIVKGMLQHSRNNSGAKEQVALNKLADEYLRLAYHGLRAKNKNFNATLHTDFDDSIGYITIVPQDIGRVVLNLLTNAFYAVHEKSLEPSSDQAMYEPTVSIATENRTKQIAIVISDNGKGISNAILDKIFQPFFTTKPPGKGTGLGLSLSYDIIKAHGGSLKAKSLENEGTTFTILIPK